MSKEWEIVFFEQPFLFFSLCTADNHDGYDKMVVSVWTADNHDEYDKMMVSVWIADNHDLYDGYNKIKTLMLVEFSKNRCIYENRPIVDRPAHPVWNAASRLCFSLRVRDGIGINRFNPFALQALRWQIDTHWNQRIRQGVAFTVLLLNKTSDCKNFQFALTKGYRERTSFLQKTHNNSRLSSIQNHIKNVYYTFFHNHNPNIIFISSK